MTPTRPELTEALERFRSELQNHPVRTSVLGTGIGFDPKGADPSEGVVVLHKQTASPSELQSIRDLAHEVAPHVSLYLLPSAQPRLLIGHESEKIED